MKKIRLTENELVSLIKRTINELDRSTYMKAGDSAKEKGLKGLANKFYMHGREKGLNPNKDVIEFAIMMGDSPRGMESVKFRIVDIIEKDENNYTLELEGVKNSMPASVHVHLTLFRLTLSHSSGKKIMLQKRKDAITLLKAFEDKGINVENIDPRQLSIEDAGI